MKLIPVAAFSLILAAGPLAFAQQKAAAPSSASVEEQLKQLDHKWMDSERTLDVPYCQKFFADGYVLVLANGQVLTKKEWLGILAGPDHPTITKLEPTNIQVHLFGNAAIITDHISLRGHDSKGNSMDGEFTVFRVVTKQNGQWRATGVVMNAVADQK